MILLAAVHGVAFFDRLLVAFLAPVLKAALSLSDTQLGIVLGSGFALVFSLASFALMGGSPLGRDPAPRGRGALAAAIALWGLATAACGAAGSFAALLAARMLMGLAQAALSPLALPMIAAAVPGAVLGRAVALYTGASTLGRGAALLGGAFGLSLVAVPLAGRDAWRLLFLLSALPNVALALLVLARAPRPAPRPAALPGTGAGDGSSPWSGVDLRRLGAVVAASAAVVLVVQTETAWATSLLVRRFGLTVAQAGTLFGLVVLAAAPLGQAAGGWLVDRLPPRFAAPAPAVVMAAALVAALPAATALALAPSLAAAGAAFAALTFILGVATPLGPYAVQRGTPPALRGRATAGLLGSVTALGFGLGPASLGVLTDHIFGMDGIGWSLVCVCAAAAGIAVAAAAWTLRRGCA